MNETEGMQRTLETILTEMHGERIPVTGEIESDGTLKFVIGEDASGAEFDRADEIATEIGDRRGYSTYLVQR
jgi:hypothetical protein